MITVRGGDAGPVRPVGLARGTVVELAGLFSATPARLKFLRSDRAEAQAIGDVVRRLAMASPRVAFTLSDVSDPDAPRSILRLDAESEDFFDGLQARLRAVLGAEFVANSLSIEASRETLGLCGYAALPTFSRGAAVAQYLFVNDRPVRDKLLIGALRAAYADVLPRGRHPVAALFVTCPPEEVDVNVHPAKSEVRFRDPGMVRGLVVGALKQALADAGHRGATTTAAGMLGAFRPQSATAERPGPSWTPQSPGSAGGGRNMLGAAAWSGRVEPVAGAGMCEAAEDFDAAADMPLGVARAQVHETYVIAQTADGVVIVDQHAAHERLVYEKLKAERSAEQVPSQMLLIPEIVEMDAAALARLIESTGDMAALGLVYEPFGGNAICLRETPAILGEVDGAALLGDVADALHEGAAEELGARIDAVVSRMSCHGSIRAGRRMSGPEMNALLREMEATPLSGQCNHGRPTYVELKLDDIERLFGRR
jgi:DNA mismatch repair protein MutL